MDIPNTPRLTFSFITEADVEDLFELDSDPAVMKYLTDGKVPQREGYESVFFSRLNQYADKAAGFGLWKVTVTETQQFIGWILARPLDFFSDAPQWHNIELGWRFKQAAWGKGYATEAAKQVANMFAKAPNISTLSAIAAAQNSGSIAVMKKLGMVFVKQYLHQDPLGEVEAVYYEMPTSKVK